MPTLCSVKGAQVIVSQNFALLNAVRTHKSAWKDIQTLHFPRRSANNVKNQYSALKRKGLRLLADTPSCCSSMVDEQSTGLYDQWLSDKTFSSDPLKFEFGKASSGAMDIDGVCPDLESGFQLSGSGSEDPFRWLTSETESSVMTPESTEDFGSFNPQLSAPLDPLDLHSSHNAGLDFASVDSIDFADSKSSLAAFEQSQDSAQSEQISHFNAFSVPDEFTVDYEQQEPLSPISIDSTLPSSTNNCTQLTIQIDGADPSTLSAVMGTLIQSRARFKFDSL